MKLSATVLLPLLHGAVSATQAASSECAETHTLPVITTDLIPGATLKPIAPGPYPHAGNTNTNDVEPPKGSALPPIIPGGSGSGSAPDSNTTPTPSDHPMYASAASNLSIKIVGLSAFVAGSIVLVLQMINF